MVKVPPHTVEVLLATVNPVGSVSVNATPVSATVLAAGLVIVNVSNDVLFSWVLVGLNALAIEGGATTVNVAVLLVVPVPPSVEVMAPVVLLPLPATVPVTFTLKVHDALWATLAPDRLITPVPAVAVTVPPQVLVTLGVPETTSVALPTPPLTGSVSLKATPVRSPTAVVLGLVMVKVRVLSVFKGTLVGLKALLIVGGATTVSEVLEVLPVPAIVSLTVTLLGANPATVPLTLTEIVHEAPAARLAPVKETLPEPAVAVGVVLQVFVRLLGLATTRVPGAAFGKVSVNEMPFRTDAALEFGLVIVNVRLVVPLSGMAEAPKTLLIVGGLMTVMLALAVFPVRPPASVAVIAPLTLFCTPSLTPFTSTATVQVCVPPALKVIVPPERVMDPLPAAAVTVPLQVFETLGVLATASPEGRLSVNARPFSPFAVLGLVMVKVSVLTVGATVKTGIWVLSKLLLICGGNSTVISTLAANPSTTAWT